jgi:site-specific DNA recombinase
MSRTVVRCAIYTRKSSEEGLDQEYNSLDAQAEACAAYIASQRHEGWKMLPARYDDGGVSGGTLERPALRRLLADIEAGRIDMVIIYKIDRLTRSLADFAKLVERFEAARCSFVSVTQAFNTSTSMGRLTLNVLLSFAQFEREVTAERIRDKVAASKKKGLWMGGLVPLGYDPHPDRTRRELVVNDAEAEVVRRLFTLYLAHGCLNATAAAAREAGLRSKRRVFASGRVQGDGEFSRGHIHKLLINPLYRGLTRHKERTWPGTHAALIDPETWERVQARLQAASARRRGTGTRAASTSTAAPSAPLTGKIRDEAGDLLTPSHSQRHGRRLRYYLSNRLVTGGRDPSGWRLPAPAFEQAVAQAIAQHLADLASGHRVLEEATAATAVQASARVQSLAEEIGARGICAVAPLVACGRVSAGQLSLALDRATMARRLDLGPAELSSALLDIAVPFASRRRGVEMKIIAGERQTSPDPAMLRALRHAHRWAHMLKAGTPLKVIAAREGFSESYVGRILPLATLAPRLQEAIVTGTQPIELNLETLVRTGLPLDWSDQEQRFARRR